MRELGKSYCGECGRKSKVLIVGRGNIWSKCKSCGFTEWEWHLGDAMDYLHYLAEHYGIPLKELQDALRSD